MPSGHLKETKMKLEIYLSKSKAELGYGHWARSVLRSQLSNHLLMGSHVDHISFSGLTSTSEKSKPLCSLALLSGT